MTVCVSAGLCCSSSVDELIGVSDLNVGTMTSEAPCICVDCGVVASSAIYEFCPVVRVDCMAPPKDGCTTDEIGLSNTDDPSNSEERGVRRYV